MRRQRILTLHRRVVKPRRKAYGVRFSYDGPETIRVLPSEWTDPEDKTIGIHRPIQAADMVLEPFDGTFMDLLKVARGGDASLYAWTALFSNFGLLYDPKDGMELYRIETFL
jgi:hypothetical protein